MGFLRKALIGLCLALALASFGALPYLDWYYSLNRPREPRPEEGRTVRMPVAKGVEGTYVYITEAESRADPVLFSAALIFAVVGGALAARWGYKPSRVTGEQERASQLSSGKRGKGAAE